MGASPSDVQLPYITFVKISNEHIMHIAGSSGIERPRYQVDIWASTSKDAGEIALSVRHALEGKSPEGTDFIFPYVEDETEGFEPPIDGSNQGTFRVSQDFIIWAYEQTTPV